MNLEEAIHQRWAADDALIALLPVEKVTTGRSTENSVPYATIQRRGSRTAIRTNTGDALDEVSLEIHVWHEDHDAGLAITSLVKAAFQRSDFALSGSDRVVQMRRSGDSAVQHADGLWQFSIDFLVQVYLASGG